MAKRKAKKQPKPAPKGLEIKNDETACVILIRNKSSEPWDLMARTTKKSVAWRSAFSTERQERQAIGNKKFEAVVMLAEDYEAGKLKSRLKAPPGFVFDPEPKKETPTAKFVEAAKSSPKTATTKEVAEKAGMKAEGKLANKPFLGGTPLVVDGKKLGDFHVLPADTGPKLNLPPANEKIGEGVGNDKAVAKVDPAPAPVTPAPEPEKPKEDLSAKFKAFLDD